MHKDPSNVLVVEVVNAEAKNNIYYVCMSLYESVNAPSSDVRSRNQFDFHVRFGQLSYDAIERMARDLDSGIWFKDKKGPTCVTCAQGKQRRNKLFWKEKGRNALFYQVGGHL